MAKLEEKVDNLKEDVGDIKTGIKGLTSRFDSLDKKYITRSEAAVMKWMIGFLTAAMAVLATWFAGR